MPFYGQSLSDSAKITQFVQKGQIYDLKLFITDKNYTSDSLNQILDTYNNNLLHIATLKNDCQMVEYLLECGLNFVSFNAFGQTSWDIAILLRNEKIINMYILHKIKLSIELNQKITELQTRIKSLENDKRNVENDKRNVENRLARVQDSETENISLRYKNNSLTADLTDIKVKHSRALDDNSELERCNKKLRTENNDLIAKNTKLKISIDNLIANSKK
jgi:hypothetical protein